MAAIVELPMLEDLPVYRCDCRDSTCSYTTLSNGVVAKIPALGGEECLAIVEREESEREVTIPFGRRCRLTHAF